MDCFFQIEGQRISVVLLGGEEHWRSFVGRICCRHQPQVCTGRRTKISAACDCIFHRRRDLRQARLHVRILTGTTAATTTRVPAPASPPTSTPPMPAPPTPVPPVDPLAPSTPPQATQATPPAPSPPPQPPVPPPSTLHAVPRGVVTNMAPFMPFRVILVIK